MRWLAGLVVATYLAGCGSAQVKRTIATQGWQELTSDHFVLVTDLAPTMAALRIRELETMWHALADNYVLVAPALPPPKHKLHVVHLNNCSDFRRVIWSDGIGGFVSTTIDFERSRIMVTCEWRRKNQGGRRTQSPRTEILLHELAHIFNNHYFSRTPAWLNEGLASYYQTLGLDKGRVIIGRLSFMDVGKWRRPKWLPSVLALVGFSYRDFYAKQRKHYYAAWKLIHVLNSTNEYQRLFRRYLSQLAKGVAHTRAWRTSVGTIAAASLQQAYARYERRSALRLWTRSYRPKPNIGAHSLRPLRVGQVHALWAHLQMIRADASGKGASGAAAVTAHLGYAAADDKTWPGTLFWRASFAFHFGKSRGEASRLLRRYVGQQPNDGRGWLGLVKVGLASLVPTDHLGIEATAPMQLASLAADVTQLARVARTAEQLNTVAWYYGLRRQPHSGLNFVRRALTLHPQCTSCMNTLALLLFQSGNRRQAAALMNKAIHLRAEQRVPASWRKRLNHYRAAMPK